MKRTLIETVSLFVASLFLLVIPSLAAEIRGILISEITNKPIPDAEVFLVELGKSTISDKSGSFIFKDIPEGYYTLIVSAKGYEVLTESINIDKDIVELSIKLKVAIEVLLEEEVVTQKKVVLDTSPQVSAQTFDQEEIQDQAGVLEDVMKALQVLPGIALVGDFAADMYIRGGDRGENAIFIDRIFVMFPYHLAGGLSIINTELVKEVKFYTGGFPAEYPLAVSGVTDVTYREGPAEKIRGSVMLSLLSLSTWLGAPLSDNVRVLASFRRSYYDWLVSALARKEDIVFPFFGEYMTKLTWDPSLSHKIRFLALIANDGLDISGAEDVQTDEERDILYQHDTYVLGVDWRYLIQKNLYSNATLSYQYQTGKVGITGADPVDMDLKINLIALRQDTVYEYPAGRFQTGIVGAILFMDVVSSFPIEDVLPGVDVGDKPKTLQIDFSRDEPIYLGGLYAQNEADIVKNKLRANIGARADHYALDAEGWDFSPRSALSYLATEKLVFKLAWGIYYDPPLDVIATDREIGNPNLMSERATHYVAGVEYKLFEHSLLRFESYYKDLDRLIYREIDWHKIEIGNNTYYYADPKEDVHYFNSGRGRAYGCEVFLQKRRAGFLDGWLAYGYALTERNSGLSGKNATGWYYPTQDQRHTLNLVANFRLPRLWTISLDFKYHSGRPYTPIVDWKKTELEGETWWEPKYGDLNSARYPDYHRLDVRLQKTWRFSGWAFSAFTEIYNVYNQKNVYSYFYTNQKADEKPKREATYGLPFLPFIGVRAVF